MCTVELAVYISYVEQNLFFFSRVKSFESVHYLKLVYIILSIFTSYSTYTQLNMKLDGHEAL